MFASGLRAGLLLACFVPLTANAAQDNARSKPSVAQQVYPNINAFVDSLKEIRADILDAHNSPKKLAPISTSLPDSWDVQTSEGPFQIDTKSLRDDLSSALKRDKDRSVGTSEALAWIDDVTTQAQNYSITASATGAAARADAANALKRILSHREFGGTNRESAIERLRRQVNDYIWNFVEKVFQRMGRHPLGAKFLLWTILALGLAWIATSLVRIWQRRIAIPQAWMPGTVVPKLSAQEWVRKARETAERGDFRQGIQCVYWAGIVHLQNADVLPDDLTRTPREYLRELSGASGSEKRLPLGQLTKQLERIWYGLFPAGSDDFQGCMQNLRDLGYPLR